MYDDCKKSNESEELTFKSFKNKPILQISIAIYF